MEINLHGLISQALQVRTGEFYRLRRVAVVEVLGRWSADGKCGLRKSVGQDFFVKPLLLVSLSFLSFSFVYRVVDVLAWVHRSTCSEVKTRPRKQVNLEARYETNTAAARLLQRRIDNRAAIMRVAC